MHVSVQSKGIKAQVQNWFQGDWSVFVYFSQENICVVNSAGDTAC